MSLPYPMPYYVEHMTADDFILGMLALGTPIEMSVVGSFDDAATRGRGSRRDMDLPLHRDGVYSAKLAEAQGGHYVERPNIDVVGLYCVREGAEPCFTTIGLNDDGPVKAEFDLKAGDALIFDNYAVFHGRRGPVGNRILIRFWIGRHP